MLHALEKVWTKKNRECITFPNKLWKLKESNNKFSSSSLPCFHFLHSLSQKMLSFTSIGWIRNHHSSLSRFQLWHFLLLPFISLPLSLLFPILSPIRSPLRNQLCSIKNYMSWGKGRFIRDEIHFISLSLFPFAALNYSSANFKLNHRTSHLYSQLIFDVATVIDDTKTLREKEKTNEEGMMRDEEERKQRQSNLVPNGSRTSRLKTRTKSDPLMATNHFNDRSFQEAEAHGTKKGNNINFLYCHVQVIQDLFRSWNRVLSTFEHNFHQCWEYNWLPAEKKDIN